MNRLPLLPFTLARIVYLFLLSKLVERRIGFYKRLRLDNRAQLTQSSVNTFVEYESILIYSTAL